MTNGAPHIPALVEAVFGVPFHMPLPALVMVVTWYRMSLAGYGWSAVRRHLSDAELALGDLLAVLDGEQVAPNGEHPADEALRHLRAARAAFTGGADRFGPLPPAPWSLLTLDALDERYRC